MIKMSIQSILLIIFDEKTRLEFYQTTEVTKTETKKIVREYIVHFNRVI